MTDTLTGLRRKIDGAGDLKSVVRTMKASAAASIGKYEKSVEALADYARTVELGLGASVRSNERANGRAAALDKKRAPTDRDLVHAIVFGSDQGLVGRFNEVLVDYAMAALALLPGKPRVWAVGARAHARLADAGILVTGGFSVPGSVHAITSLVGRLLVECLGPTWTPGTGQLLLFYNRPQNHAGYGPVSQRLLPLDDIWLRKLADIPWPTGNLPEVIGDASATLRALIHEYLFISLFRASAESLASENASRLAAMQRADRNIGELLESLNAKFHRLRQIGIDEELFDVIAGFGALDGSA